MVADEIKAWLPVSLEISGIRASFERTAKVIAVQVFRTTLESVRIEWVANWHFTNLVTLFAERLRKKRTDEHG